ncbi:hypothetical protein [Iodobacter fluviatilis]|uniref:Uncharacterized protein n=1 Tax=Iodobacter fluviatilis TaxID=537 RepID=A0A7G3GCB1_9NEIS|nr:hypothetical protein [Iodobacter fluviatilis]QBC44285.1 hypothetical protein C1H71_12605 [Iodobacter fluviatilis]
MIFVFAHEHPCDLASHQILSELHHEQGGDWRLERERKIEQIELRSQFVTDSYMAVPFIQFVVPRIQAQLQRTLDGG